MNKIFKVIWSKSKQCYVVVSEMAKNTTGKKKIVVASILAGLAMSTMGTHVMAVSTIPFTDKPSSALANGSVKNNTTNGVAIGNAAYSDSNQSIAIGFRSFASGTFLGGSIKPSVAVGAGAHAEGNNTVAIGTVAENRASYGVALGNESKVTSGSDYGIAIGYQTQVSAVHGMAIGEKASASGLIGMALGANAQATGAYSYAGGFNSASGGEAAIAVGKSASATGGDSIALGKNANASNGDSIAIGQDTVSDKINSVALGKTSQATGASATALGPQAKATGSTAVAIGLNSEANQSATVAVGYNSAASGENAAAYGNTAKAVGKNSLALGANTQATVEGGVALGAGSIANTVAGAGYNPNTGRTNTFTGLSGNALTSTWAAVSIGDGTNTRQLTGLAAGTNNTDAVNVAQLKSMNLAFTADGSTKGDVNLTNSALNVVGDSTYITTKGDNQTLTISGKKQTITVTNGTASASAGMADANNVAQAINQANADQTISYKANGGTANTVKVSDGLNFTNGASTVATVGANGQVTYDLNSTTKQSITDSSTAVNRTIALGSDSGSTTAKKLSTSAIAFNIKGDTGANALITTTATGDNVSITPTAKLTAAVAAAENAANKNLSNISSSGETVIKNLAKGAAQDAVKVAGTGLATVSDNTVGGVKTYTVDVNTGNLVVAANGQVGAAGTTGASGAAGSNGVATTQNVATAINDAVTKAKASTTQALADAEHKFAGDTGTTSVRKHGEVLSIKGGVTNAASLTTGNIGVVSDGTGTLNIRLAKVLSGLTSATFTTAGGNTTVINGDGVTITPSGAGASAISMTTAGINAGNKEIKGVATGTTADAAVNKAQMDAAITAAASGSLSTEKVVAKTLSGDNNLATVTGQTGTAKGETYEVSVSENAVKNVAKAAAQDAVIVTGTGLATVSDTTTGGVKTYTVDVNTGNLVVAANGQVGAAGTTGASGAAGSNGVATTQNVATAINDAVTKANANNAQALADAKHNFAGDDATVISRKHGEQLNIKGGASTTATDLTSGNIAVVGDTASGTLNIKMAKALTGLTSATFTDGSGNTQTVTGGASTISDAAGNSTVVSKGRVTTTDAAGNITTTAPTGLTVTPAGTGTTPISVTTSGISAGNKEIKNVANGTTDDAAVNKKQMDDAVKAASDATKALGNNTIALGGDTGSTTAKKLSTNAITFNIKGDTGANALITTSATGDNVTIAPTAKLTAAVTAAEKSADKDLSNISSAGKTVIKDLAATSVQDAVNVTGTGLATVSDNTAGGVKTYTVNVDEGKLVLDDTTGQIGANGATQGTTAGKNGVATTQNVATAINDAVTKAKASTAQALADAEHKFDGDTGTTSVRKHGEVLSIKGGVTTPADLATGNIGVISDGAGTLNIRLAKVLTGLTSATFTDGSGNTQTVTGASSTITDGAGHTTAMTKGGLSTTDGTNTTTVAPAGVTATDGTNTVKLNGSGIDAGNTQIKNVGKATTDDAAVNKKQMDDAVKAATDATTALGNNTIALGGDTGSTTAKKLSTNAITFNIKGDTGANALITTSATGDNVTIAPTAKLTDAVTAAEKSADKDLSNISTAGKTVIKDLAVTSAQDAVNVTGTGLATVSSNTAGGVKTYTVDVKAGNLVVDANGQAGAAGATGTGGAVGTDGVATTQNVATAINDAITKSNANTAQALADAEHKFDGDTGSTSVRKHGEVLSIKGGVANAADLTTGNIGVVSDGAGTLNIRLAKVLSGLTSATFTDGNGNTQTVTGGSSTISDAAGNSTVVSKGGVTTTDAAGNSTTTAPTGVTVTPAGGTPISITTDGINAGGKEVKGIANGTTNDAAVNKGQMDAAVQNALDGTQALGNNTITLGGDTGSTDAKKLNTSGGIQFNIKGGSGANALITTTASGNSVSIASTTKLSNAVAAAENAANKDLSNLSANGESRIKDLAKSAASWNVQTNDGPTTAVSGGDTVNFKDGKNITITNTGREIKVATKDDVSFNKVTVGSVTLDNNGIDAGNKEIKNVATGTTPNSAVNKQQLENALAGVSNINYTTSSTTDRAGSTPVRSVALSTGFDFKGDGNIQITEDAANNGVIHYAMNPNLSGITSITGAGNGAPTMTFNSQNGNTPANVSINSNLDMGGHRITGVGPAEKPTDAVNKQQVDQALRGLTGMADNAARQYASKAGANAAALAALKPIQYDPLEPTQIMAGVGNYKSQTAVALGMAHYTNENTMFNIGVSLDSHDNMINAGVTHKFGYSPEKKAIPDRYKGGPISSIYVMQDEMQALLAKDQEKDAVISKQASEIDTLRQQNEEMQRKIDMILAKLK